MALLLLVQSPRQSPKSGAFRYFLLHIVIEVSTLSLQTLILQTLCLHPLVIKTLFLQHFSLPNTLSPNYLSLNSHFRHALTMLIHRVSGSRQATMYNARCNLWGVVQLLTSPPFFGNQNKLVHLLWL